MGRGVDLHVWALHCGHSFGSFGSLTSITGEEIAEFKEKYMESRQRLPSYLCLLTQLLLKAPGTPPPARQASLLSYQIRFVPLTRSFVSLEYLI